MKINTLIINEHYLKVTNILDAMYIGSVSVKERELENIQPQVLDEQDVNRDGSNDKITIENDTNGSSSIFNRFRKYWNK